MLAKNSVIYVAGHTGLIGSAVLRRFAQEGYQRLVTRDRKSLDLQDAGRVAQFFGDTRPEFVVLAAGRVGGIVENQTFPADFMNENIAIQLNVLSAARKAGVQKLIFFGSSCMYPRECPQPMPEQALLSGMPEPTSLPYAVSKLAGTHMCMAYNKQDGATRFIPIIPNSAYGPHDNFDPKSGHVLSALIARFHHAKTTGAESVMLWGTGSPRREFIYADDIADACLHILTLDSVAPELPLNIGSGTDVSIKELAELIADVVGYKGRLEWDRTKPDGAPRKLLDSARIQALGWKPRMALPEGLAATYQWYVNHVGVDSTPVKG